jgi:indole-3-glycerol phosphate synthase
MSGTPLPAILADVRRRAAVRRRKSPLERLKRTVAQDLYRRERVLNAFQGPGFKLVAECKRRSPGSGTLIGAPGVVRSEHHDWSDRAVACARGGAAALSIWTEQDHFGGRLADLRTVEHVALPRLRRDFLLDEGMVWETMPYGADMVLFSTAALSAGELRALAGLARELGLAVWIDAHDEAGLELALALEPELVGVSARDPLTLAVDPRAFERLLPRIPAGPARVAAGGIAHADDLKRARDAGAGAARVGTALMRSADPAATLAAWRAALEA